MKERELMQKKLTLIEEIDNLYLLICGAKMTTVYTAKLMDKPLLTLWYKKERLEAILSKPIVGN